MIFLTVGSQKFQFNRLLKAVDKLIEDKIIDEEVFAQIGYSDYNPKNYKYKQFLDKNEFEDIMSKCDKIITHGGTGVIIRGIKQMKKVIAMARLKEYGEHVDNHQMQIISQFSNMKMILSVENIDDLEEGLYKLDKLELRNYASNTYKIIESIKEYIDKI